MPVTFRVAKHGADRRSLPESTSAQQILYHACGRNNCEVLQSSINPSEYPTVISTPNGFVETVLEAYGRHRNLIIRPDDVWMAILVQFQFYVNANAEKLRTSFVAHEGKKELVVVLDGESRHTMDFGWFARRISELLHENVVDKDLVRWVLPDFTTTTLTDTTACAIVLMATTQKYFSFRGIASCGIPQVTLEGEKQDWIDILSRLDKLADFGEQPLAWSHLLRVVLTRFISAFDSPDSAANVDFWQRIANIQPLVCNGEFLSGWITAFCVWNKDGKWIGPEINELLNGGVELENDPVPPPDQPSIKYDGNGMRVYNHGPAPPVTFDGRPFGAIDFNRIPPGYASVPVKVEDREGVFNCEMVAGHIGWHFFAQTLAASMAHTPPPAIQTHTPKLANDQVSKLLALAASLEEKEPQKAQALIEFARASLNLNGEVGDGPFGDTVQPASAWFIIERKEPLVENQLYNYWGAF